MALFRTTALSLSLAMAAVSLAGCKQEAKPQGGDQASAAPQSKPGTTIGDARLVLPAVKGNPGAAYFSVSNGTSSTMAIAAISVEGAEKAEIHQTVGTQMTPVDRIDMAPGTVIVFEPGRLHVMAFKLSDNLKPGGMTEVTVTFADGDKTSAKMKIESAGDAAMGGMDHGDGH
ncbi:MAG: copper chaperone PCu(A)C [Proteobacteria bacterium]|nr:copper chaperone PCu(A)C [Pseudomonadota bacterium]